jgi:hypothetical protein
VRDKEFVTILHTVCTRGAHFLRGRLPSACEVPGPLDVLDLLHPCMASMQALRSVGGQLLLKGNGYVMNLDALTTLRSVGGPVALLNNGNLRMALPPGVSVGAAGRNGTLDDASQGTRPLGDIAQNDDHDTVLVVHGFSTPAPPIDAIIAAVDPYMPPLPVSCQLTLLCSCLENDVATNVMLSFWHAARANGLRPSVLHCLASHGPVQSNFQKCDRGLISAGSGCATLLPARKSQQPRMDCTGDSAAV